ncbi:MAG: hypothetical protein NC416_09955 [Eubacterium sp.]|nr:hypothetical protein [Eubacterium sp.]
MERSAYVCVMEAYFSRHLFAVKINNRRQRTIQDNRNKIKQGKTTDQPMQKRSG